MLDGNSEKPNVEEQYQTAGNTSNLTVEADRRGAGDVLIAAGWSPSRVGMALLRLHSEFDSAAKPKHPSKEVVQAKVAELKAEDALRRSRGHSAPASSPIDRTRAYFDRQMASDLRLLATSLKSRPVVWEQIGAWIAIKGIGPDIAAEALLHWLDSTCRTCDGHGLRKVPDQPALSARQCHKCHGTGHTPHPHGSAKLLSYMDDCVQKARQSLKNRLRNG